MRIEIKRNCLVIIPECEQDTSFIEDTLNVKTGEELKISKISDISLGFTKDDTFVLKIEQKL